MKSSKIEATNKVARINKVGDKARDILVPVADRLAQAAGIAFILATSYAFTQDWLKSHQLNHDYSVAGGIMVVTIALYLVIRKR